MLISPQAGVSVLLVFSAQCLRIIHVVGSLMFAFNAMNFPLHLALATSYKYGMLCFISFRPKSFLISLEALFDPWII